MELKIFEYTTKALEKLDEMTIDLEIASKELENYFANLVRNECIGYINISSRVKSRDSLKEKILRHDFYNKYKTISNLYENLVDLIGIRLECRFIEDERDIYKLLKRHFTQEHVHTAGYYYKQEHTGVILELKSVQPKNQKNGLKMYRIDGKYLYNDQIINFEVQIKALVNIFWSEIEHNVIYKNYNYIIADRFYKDIMYSIKNSLTTIDGQLLLISNHFKRDKPINQDIRQMQLEQMLSKSIYDLFADRMKNNIGLIVDFRKSCDTLVKYVFREIDMQTEETYRNLLMKALNRLNEIDNDDINFNSIILFEREIDFNNDDFSIIIGSHIQRVLNEEFQWNLFFRILFYIEPEDNAGDFENFIKYYKYRLSHDIVEHFQTDDAYILDELLLTFANTFTELNSVSFVYDDIIEKVKNILWKVTSEIQLLKLKSQNHWNQHKPILLKLLYYRILDLLNADILATDILRFMHELETLNMNLPKSLIKYI
ncbi:GTP pyrophosphokinase [Candidatus Epulonipiscium viviparus]|uniref:GTP pyrophosphokinase n=1 Tax=Candidatus Epulonipiscium viviparus TaxID=420336 RepID=UPI0027380BA9|nr:(p)ppGpp synthetase [Candidatus Epulopiscium viviparus]